MRLLLAAAGTAGLAAPSQVLAATDLTLASSNTPGVSCADIKYDCPEPSSAKLYVDSVLLIDYSAGMDMVTPPTSPCFDESEVGSGTHSIQAKGTCGGVETTDTASFSFSNPAVDILDVKLPAFSHTSGDTVAVTVYAAATGLDLAVDFGAVDSEYDPGDETVVEIGGGTYVVTYVLSGANTTAPGEYELPIEVTDGLVNHTIWDAFTVRYTPGPTGAVTFHDDTNADFVIGDLPVGTSTVVAPNNGTFRVTNISGAMATLGGKVVSSTNLDGKPLIVNLREDGTEGYATTEVWISGSTCVVGGTCSANISLPLRVRPSHVPAVSNNDTFSFEISLGTYSGVGAVAYTPATSLSPVWTLLGKQPANTTDMRGKLTYTRIVQNGAANPSGAKHPQYGLMTVRSSTHPLRKVTIEILDECNHVYTALTNEAGEWQRFVPKECPGDPDYTVRAKPHSGTGGVFRVVSRGYNGLTHNSALGSATIPSNVTSHNWGTKHYTTADSEYGEFSSFMAGIRVQEWAKPFLVGDAQTGAFPTLFFKFDNNNVGCGGTSCYDSGADTILVCGTASNPDHKDPWALGHETFHWFQHQFMAALDGNAGPNAMAGAFGEGFASMMMMELLGTVWKFNSFNGINESELLDFEGNFKRDNGGVGDWVAALPLSLYNTTGDQGSGGWSWRILWDFQDGTATEPETEFTRYDTGAGVINSSNPTMTDFGDFDTFGSKAAFRDVIVKYLGGNFMPDNTSRPDIDLRGGVGLDMTEFLDGALCRNHVDWVDIEPLINDMMQFTSYNNLSAPPTCP